MATDADNPTLLQVLVLERVDRAKNMARFYVLSIEPTLFEDLALVRRLRQEDGQGLRREGLRRHRGRTRSASRGDGHWRGSGQADHRRLGRAEDRPGDYGFPS